MRKLIDRNGNYQHLGLLLLELWSWPKQWHVGICGYPGRVALKGEWPSALRCCNQNQKFPVQTPPVAPLGLGTQPRYEAPGDLRVKYV